MPIKLKRRLNEFIFQSPSWQTVYLFVEKEGAFKTLTGLVKQLGNP